MTQAAYHIDDRTVGRNFVSVAHSPVWETRIREALSSIPSGLYAWLREIVLVPPERASLYNLGDDQWHGHTGRTYAAYHPDSVWVLAEEPTGFSSFESVFLHEIGHGVFRQVLDEATRQALHDTPDGGSSAYLDQPEENFCEMFALVFNRTSHEHVPERMLRHVDPPIVREVLASMTRRDNPSWMQLRAALPNRRSPLYHNTTGPAVANIVLRGEGLHKEESGKFGGTQVGISLTRNFDWAAAGQFGSYVLIIDGDRLDRGKLRPVAYPRIGDEFEERYFGTVPVSAVVGIYKVGEWSRLEKKGFAEDAPQIVLVDESNLKGRRSNMRGGRADGMDPAAFDQAALAHGAEHEREHTDDPRIATEIAMDHLVEDPQYYAKLEAMERTSNPASLQALLQARAPQIAQAAQAVYDAWEQDEDGYDEELGGGGICDRVSAAIQDVVNDIDGTEGGQDGDFHAFPIFYTDTEACAVDISPYVYETGGGYAWRKRAGVTIRPEDVEVFPINREDLGDMGERWENPAQGVPVFRGVGPQGLKSVRNSEEGVLGPGVYWYTSVLQARSYSSPGGGVLAALVQPSAIVAQDGDVVVTDGARGVSLRGYIPNELTAPVDDVASPWRAGWAEYWQGLGNAALCLKPGQPVRLLNPSDRTEVQSFVEGTQRGYAYGLRATRPDGSEHVLLERHVPDAAGARGAQAYREAAQGASDLGYGWKHKPAHVRKMQGFQPLPRQDNPASPVVVVVPKPMDGEPLPAQAVDILEELDANAVVPGAIPFGSVSAGEMLAATELRRNPPISKLVKPSTSKTAIPLTAYFTPLADALFNSPAFAHLVQASALADTRDELLRYAQAFHDVCVKQGKEHYANGVRPFLAWLSKFPDTTDLAHPVFFNGISKLGPNFFEFSTLPGITCPGAGRCLQNEQGNVGWCYSFRALMYAESFFRRVQNTILLRTYEGQEAIRRAVAALPQGRAVRLYVDGDFDSADTMAFWQGLMPQRPDLHFYGYSKSWHLFLGHPGPWAPNYFLNVSNGSRFDGDAGMLQGLTQLPVYRGRFLMVSGVPFGAKQAKAMIAEGRRQEYLKAVRQTAEAAGIKNPWVCPGNCGACLPGGRHACGDAKFRGVNIVIGKH